MHRPRQHITFQLNYTMYTSPPNIIGLRGLLILWMATTLSSAFSHTAWNECPTSTTTTTTTRHSVAPKNQPDVDLTSSRRAFLTMSGLMLGMGMFPTLSLAKYGTSSTMELPNYIEYLVEKNEQGDNSQALYKGVDPVVLLRRLQDASNRLQEIPALAATKKWSQVQGLLTGPLGTMSQTLNQFGDPKVQGASKKLKADLIAIGQAASKKNEQECIAMAEQASNDLKMFLEVAFE